MHKKFKINKIFIKTNHILKEQTRQIVSFCFKIITLNFLRKVGNRDEHKIIKFVEIIRTLEIFSLFFRMYELCSYIMVKINLIYSQKNYFIYFVISDYMHF